MFGGCAAILSDVVDHGVLLPNDRLVQLNHCWFWEQEEPGSVSPGQSITSLFKVNQSVI